MITIEELAAKLNAVITATAGLEAKVAKLEEKINDFESTDFASGDHYHDELASADHVERSEGDFRRQLSRLRDEISNLEYQVREAGRKAERAQSTADNASRSGRSYY